MYPQLLQEIESHLAKGLNETEALRGVCAIIAEKLEKYDWVGFYFMNHQSRKLHLGPYVGNPTDHTIIEFGKGICGQVAESGKTFVVDDVSAQDNYIACSIDVRSEIVVPMYRGDELIGQIDIDSHHLKAFGADDEQFLTQVNKLIIRHYPSLSLTNFI